MKDAFGEQFFVSQSTPIFDFPGQPRKRGQSGPHEYPLIVTIVDDMPRSSVYEVSYDRDAAGRIVAKTETIGGSTQTRCYGYDVAGRLVTVHDGFNPGSGACTGSLLEEYDYDANSNRIYAMNSLGVVSSADILIDDQDRLLQYSVFEAEYTENGELEIKRNTSNGQIWSHEYDVMGNLVRLDLPDGTIIEYVIDGRNRRVGRKVNGTLTQGFLYGDQLNPVAELDGSGNVVSRFVYGSKKHVPDYMVRNGVTYRIVSDHLGSVIAVVDVTSGTIVQRLEYDSWGRILVDTNVGFQPFAFAGGIWDRDAQMIRFGARDYIPGAGRWAAKDPIVFKGGSPNLYGYVLANPVDLIDTAGQAPGDPGKDWCGSDDTEWVPDNLCGPFGCTDLSPACKNHDDGYGKCRPRPEVDLDFLRDLLEICYSDWKTMFSERCYMVAMIYYAAVRIAGDGPYQKSCGGCGTE